jgi:hypothetical protein
MKDTDQLTVALAPAAATPSLLHASAAAAAASAALAAAAPLLQHSSTTALLAAAKPADCAGWLALSSAAKLMRLLLLLCNDAGCGGRGRMSPVLLLLFVGLAVPVEPLAEPAPARALAQPKQTGSSSKHAGRQQEDCVDIAAVDCCNHHCD